MDTKISSGTKELDWLLEGGYEKDVLTCIYGPPGCGKTNLLLLAVTSVASDKKVVYIDTEGNFSLSRFKQICPNHKEVLDRIIFLTPVTFEEQRNSFEKLRKIVNDKIGLIILDSVAMLYRLELGRTKDVYSVNRDLGIQLSYLTEIARKKKIPVLVTNQVYADLEQKDATRMVGGDILRYSSKCLIELTRNDDGVRKATLKKHRSLPDNKHIDFFIVDQGIREVTSENET